MNKNGPEFVFFLTAFREEETCLWFVPVTFPLSESRCRLSFEFSEQRW
jgi:hypothetical protein